MITFIFNTPPRFLVLAIQNFYPCGKIQNEIKKLNDDNDYQQCKINQSTKGDGTVLDSIFSDSSQKPITI